MHKKVEIAKQCKVPAYLENDRYEPVTQEEYTDGLLAAIKEFGLSASELEAIRDNKVSAAELRAYINARHL